MAWRALSDMEGAVRRTWERRRAAGVVRSRVDAETGELLVWVGWPRGRA